MPLSLRASSLILTCFALLGTTGCANFRRLRADNAKLDALAKIEGKVEVENWSGDPLIVAIMLKPAQVGAPVVIKGTVIMNKPGPFEVTLNPGHYMVGAFEDKNHDQHFAFGERAAGYKNFDGIDAREGAVEKGVNIKITNEVPAILRPPLDTKIVRPNPEGWGKVVPLSDARFNPENAVLGVWQPVTFAQKVGMGVFMLEEYDPARIPVVFVHGMGGHPREFETLVGCLDKQKYQFWVAQYASGWPLEPLARGFSNVLTVLQGRHNIEKMYLVAHSMGGLLSRRMLREHVQTNPKPFVSKFVTINSPLGGMPSADMGVRMAPAVVPSWRDIGPASDYVKHLYDEPLPSSISYDLFFTFHEDEAGDGVVALSSQLRMEARREAGSLAAFENTHAGVLKDPSLCTALRKVLARE